MTSLRRTITIRVVLMLALLGVGAAASTFTLVTWEMNKFLDAQLQEIAVNTGPGERDRTSPLLDSEDEDQLVIRIWDRAGSLIHRSGPAIVLPRQSAPGLSDVAAGGQDWRVYLLRNAQNDVQIAQTWSARREIATHAATGAALPLAAAVSLAWLVVGWSVKRTMRGLQRFSSEIGERSVDAQEPLRAAAVPDEVAPLITAIDRLVTRYRDALDAQRRFVAAAAHELRTPLAALQIQTDNLASGNAAEDMRDLIGELQDGVRRSSRLASQLLDMARAEGASLRTRQPIDLRALAMSLLADLDQLANARQVELALTTDRSLIVDGDPDAIRKVLTILLDNAINYSTPNRSVELRLAQNGGACTVAIIDEGSGIPEHAMPFIYDRFFRAAAPDIEGTGLGLAIAKSTAEREGFTISHCNRSAANGVIATVTFPRLDRAEASVV